MSGTSAFWSWCSVARGRPGGSHTRQEWFAAYVVRAPGREAEGPRAAGPQAADPEPESDAERRAMRDGARMLEFTLRYWHKFM